MRLLSLDIGMKRTGVAFVDTDNNIPLPLDTIESESIDEFAAKALDISVTRGADTIIVGLPLLPSGDEGSQSEYVRECAERLQEAGITIEFVDERYTTNDGKDYDGDARAACQLLQMYLERL